MGLFGDSWASNTSKTAANTLGTEAGSLFSEGQSIQAQLLPFLRGELNANSAFSPTQLNEMLSYAGAGAGGAAGSLSGQAALEATRTGNSAGIQGVLDSIARAKSQGLARANEGIAAEDVAQTQANKQSAASGMGQLYGADTGDALKAMGLQNEAVGNQIKASSTGGWFGNLMGTLGDFSKMALQGAQTAALV
jgi:hypothetical protein